MTKAVAGRPWGGESDGGRDCRLDLLKVLGSFAVVVVHVSAELAVRVDPSSASWWLTNVSNAAGRWGSAVFVMVGGAVLLARASEADPMRFIGSRMARLLPAVAFWTAFYLCWRQWMWGELPWTSIVREVAQGMPFYHMWFMYMMLGLYLVMPALRLVVRDEGLRRVQYGFLGICALLTGLEATVQTLMGRQHAGFLGLSPFFVVYLVGGYLLYRDRPELPVPLLVTLAVASVTAMALGVAVSHPYLGDAAFALMYSNRGPFAMVLTFSLFLLGLKLSPLDPVVRKIALLGPVTLGIYAVHPFWIGMLSRWGWGFGNIDPFWLLPALAVPVYVLSALTALGLSRIPGLRRVVR